MLERIALRVTRWLGRKGLLRDEDASNAPPSMTPVEALTAAALARGTLDTVREEGDRRDDEGTEPADAYPAQRSEVAVTVQRFNLHAAVALRADDDVGRERLCRYLARPPFALSRLRKERDGSFTCRVKKASRGRVKVRRMSGVECLARLAAIVAPPRYPLSRLHGVLAPRHAWRGRIVPRPPVASRPACAASLADLPPRPKKTEREEHHAGDGRAALALAIPRAVPTAELTASGHAERAGPNVLSFAHWARLLDGALFATTSRVDWATLLQRTFDIDVLRCARCDGPLRVRAVVTDSETIASPLAVLRRPRDPPLAVA